MPRSHTEKTQTSITPAPIVTATTYATALTHVPNRDKSVETPALQKAPNPKPKPTPIIATTKDNPSTTTTTTTTISSTNNQTAVTHTTSTIRAASGASSEPISVSEVPEAFMCSVTDHTSIYTNDVFETSSSVKSDSLEEHQGYLANSVGL